MGNHTYRAKSDPTALLEDEIELLLTNTVFTREQISKWHTGFLSDCPSGELEKDKFIKEYKDFFQNDAVELFSNEIFDLFDRDNSGKIDFTEFVIAVSVTANTPNVKKLEAAFNLYDSEKAGTVGRDKIEDCVAAIFNLLGLKERTGENDPKERASAILKENETLDRAQFVERFLSDSVLERYLNPQPAPQQSEEAQE